MELCGWSLSCEGSTLAIKHCSHPGFLLPWRFATHSFSEHLHPVFLNLVAVGVKVDYLAISKLQSESIFDEHVALLVLSESRLPSSFALLWRGIIIGLGKRGLVVNELGCFGQGDSRTWLSSRVVVCGELRAIELEEAATPELK